MGALTSQPYRFRARPWDIEGAGGICTLCPSQCNVEFTVRDDKVLRVLARENPGVDDGWLCDKGRFAYQAIHVDERITTPLVRNAGGELEPASWDAALTAAGAIAGHRGRVGALVGGQASNEEAFLLGRMLREGLDSRDIDSRFIPATHPHQATVDLPVARALAAPALQATRPRHRVRAHRAGARHRAARRLADPRPSHPQGRAPQRCQVGDRDGPAEHARPQR